MPVLCLLTTSGEKHCKTEVVHFFSFSVFIFLCSSLFYFMYIVIFLSHTESGASCLKTTLQDRSLIDYRMIFKNV